MSQSLDSKIQELARAAARPFYVYSSEQITRRCAELKAAFPADVEIFYSLKANSHPEVIALVRASGFRADVASKGELHVAIEAGYLGHEIEFTGPGKTLDELETAANHDVAAVVLESAQELIELERVGRRLAKKMTAHVRLNPRKKLNYAGRLIEDEPTQFGVDSVERKHFIATLATCHNVEIVGTHTHAQSQTLAAEHTVKNFEFAAEAAQEFADLSGISLSFVNLGGGIGIPYSSSQTSVDLAVVGQGMADVIKQVRTNSHFAKTVFRVEFGRAIVGEAGRFITRVLYTKTSRGQRFAITDGGFTQAQIVCGVGQLVRRNFQIRALKRERGATELITVAGPSCYGLDILATEIELPHLDPGDLLCIENVGAYGYSFSPTGFLRQQSADEYVI